MTSSAVAAMDRWNAIILLLSLPKVTSCHDECFSPDSSSGTCRADVKGKKWRWDPTTRTHPCNIRRISHSELLQFYGPLGLPNLYPFPLIIYPEDFPPEDSSREDQNNKKRSRHNALFSSLTTIENLPEQFSRDFNVTLTGSDSLSSNRRSIPLTQYLDESLVGNHDTGYPGETLPDQLGNETWYLFGETFTSEWSQFLRNYHLPKCHSCTQRHYEEDLVALSFGIGNIGSGVQWHLHGPGFSETIHGRKHWVLYPPHFRPEYDLDYASRHWMEHVYPSLDDWNATDVETETNCHVEYLQLSKGFKREKNSTKVINRSLTDSQIGGPSTKKPWECTIHEGEIIYFPDQWHHATINLEKYTVFVSSFTTEH